GAFHFAFKMLQAMWAIVVALTVVVIDAQVVNVTVFTESQCKYCTSLFREQLWPFHNAHPGVMNLQFFPRHYFGLLTCIQGLRDLREAFDRCLSRLSPQTQQELIDCSITQAGEILNYYSMLNTHRAGLLSIA
uniref:Uncharacterized protein n=2 Tax=Parascaris univalens TaxID=6257 RepID=A0A915CJX1_PARUN